MQYHAVRRLLARSARAWFAILFLIAAGTAGVRAEGRVNSSPLRETAQNDAAAQPQAQAERPTADTWDRGTPRSSVQAFLRSCREDRWADAAEHLDLSQRSEQGRASEGPKLARQLKFLLDRSLWIDLDGLSDESQGELNDQLPANRELLGVISHARGDLRVMLERVAREDGQLVWKFASSTVAQTAPIYEQLGLAPILERLPDSLTGAHFLEVAPWQWIGLILLVLGAWLVAWLLSSVVVRILRPLTLKSRTDIDDKLLELIVGPLRLVTSIGVFNAGLHLLLLSVPANHFAREASKVLVIASVAWLGFRVIDLFAALTRSRFTERGQMGAVHLVPLGARAIKIAVGSMTILATLDTFGFDVTAIVAGLGVGGIAVALAAQKTLENFFGGISVLVDQPVRPGDFCKFGDKLGTVEDIGVRSTRIRTLDRTVITVPNAEFSALQLENFAERDRIRLITTLGLRYETTPDQLRHVLHGLRSLLLAHPKVLPEPQRVRLVGFGAFSLDLELFAYLDTTDFNEFLAVREDIFLRVMQVIEDSGTGFAFPSSTTYLARDGGLNPARSRAAEEQVARWRAEGKLPFPDIAPEEARAIDGTIDWPPKGSATGSAARATG